jgi:hypothetical protein
VEFSALRVGMLVDHPVWGLGKVQAVRSPYVWIYFHNQSCPNWTVRA